MRSLGRRNDRNKPLLTVTGCDYILPYKHRPAFDASTMTTNTCAGHRLGKRKFF